MFQHGEFWKVQPSRSTFSQLRSETMFGLRKLLISFHWASVRFPLGTFMLLIAAAFMKPSSGYHVRPSTTIPPEATSFFHSLSVSFSFLTILHDSPLPSMTPLPVMDMFFASWAWIGDSHLRVSRPSKTVLMIGYRLRSGSKMMTASSVMWRSHLLRISIGPVTQMPEGTFRCPPPVSLSWCMAFAKASVLSVLPSPTPPKSRMSTVYDGMDGFLTLLILNGRFL